jgi:hypothetical protein
MRLRCMWRLQPCSRFKASGRATGIVVDSCYGISYAACHHSIGYGEQGPHRVHATGRTTDIVVDSVDGVSHIAGHLDWIWRAGTSPITRQEICGHGYSGGLDDSRWCLGLVLEWSLCQTADTEHVIYLND